MMAKYELFARIMGLFHEVDKAFAVMQEQYATAVRCTVGCDDCCHACFSVSLAEALLLQKTMQMLPDRQRQQLNKGALETQPEFQRLQNAIRAGAQEAPSTIMSHWRLKCPFLLADKSCAVYEARPVTCRAYGLPTSIDNQGHVCGYSGFERGEEYPTIKLDAIHAYLFNLSAEAVQIFALDQGLAGRRYFIHQLVLEKEL